MKKNIVSNLLFLAAVSALLFAMALNPPGGAGWAALLADQSSPLRKLIFLANTYLRPAVLSFVAITLFQLQFRLASSGTQGRIVFAVCIVASGTMLLGLRTISTGASSMPSYVLGMASGYTMMSRLYAMRLRTVFGAMRVPWPVWRGDRTAVEEINRAMHTRAMQARTAAHNPA